MMSLFILPQTRLSAVCQFDVEAILFDKSDDRNDPARCPYDRYGDWCNAGAKMRAALA